MKEDENSDEVCYLCPTYVYMSLLCSNLQDSVVGAQTSRKVQCKHILVINFACVVPSGQRLQSATGSSTISSMLYAFMLLILNNNIYTESRQIEPIMRQMVIIVLLHAYSCCKLNHP